MPFSSPDGDTAEMAPASLIFALALTFSDPAGLSMNQFRHLRAEAKTSAEYRQLAEFADRQAADSRKKAAECQQELDGYRSGSAPYPAIPKYPSRAQTLTSLIYHYRQTAERWEGFSKEYVAKASVGSSDKSRDRQAADRP